MKLLALGTGPSTMDFIGKKKELDDDIKIISLHRAFPYAYKNNKMKIDYWTWGDPHASIEGLRLYETESHDDLPDIVVPYWMLHLQLFKGYSGTSPIFRVSPASDRLFYNSMMEKLVNRGKVTLLENATPTKKISSGHEIFKDPSRRFTDDMLYIGSVPFDGIGSESNWAQENYFTTMILPLSHYLGATEVYCLGFDNKGGGIKRRGNIHGGNRRIIKNVLSKFSLWKQWEQYHGMKIYSVAESKFTPNNTILEYKPIEEICKK